MWWWTLSEPPANPVAAPSAAPHWRLAIFLLASAIGVLACRLLFMILSALVPATAAALTALTGFTWMMSAGLLLGHAWTVRVAEPRGWAVMGLDGEAAHPRVVAPAALLGAAAIGGPALALLAMGWLRVEPAPDGSSLGAALVVLPLLVPGALWEELLLRGYGFTVVRERWGAWRAIAVTSAVFGVLHLVNPGASAQSVTLVTLAGCFLGYLRVRTGSVYAAWAAHLAWNLVLVAALHTEVSGVALPAPDYRVVEAGPDWATGGPWGPEGGLFAGAGLVGGIAVLSRWRPRRQGHDP